MKRCLVALLFIGCTERQPVPDAAIPDAAPPSAAAPLAEAVGPEACADCHPDHVEGFAATGMGRSVYRPAARPAIEDFSKSTVTDPRIGMTYRAYIDPDGRWWQEESRVGTAYRRRVEVRYVIGSGNHTRSYLGEVSGELMQLPLTWYSGRGIWDLSPGYDQRGWRFGRKVTPKCLFCHNDLSEVRRGTLASYRALAEGISCVRCHGDARAHVAQRSAGAGPPPGAADPSIYNPGRQSPEAQLRLCQQCHLSGEARVLRQGRRWDRYQPQTPLSEHASIYAMGGSGGAGFGIASHAERLALSRCAQQSGGRLTCTRCHDPHRADATRARRKACMECHGVEDCGSVHGQAPGADCSRCHLRRGGTSDIPHVTFTDHWIRRQPEATPPKPPSDTLVDVLAKAPPDPAATTRLGIAHAQRWHRSGGAVHRAAAIRNLMAGLPTTPRHARGWETLAELHRLGAEWPAAVAAYEAVERLSPEGVLFRLGQAEALRRTGRADLAAVTLERAVSLRPDYVAGWTVLGDLLQELGRLDEAAAAYDRADALAPHLPEIADGRGTLAMRQNKPAEARRWFSAALERDPRYARGHFNLATLALTRGDAGLARSELNAALALDPQLALAYWIRGRLRRTAKDLAGARADFEAMVRTAPGDANGYLELAATLRMVGDDAKAREVLGAGLQQLPGDPALTAALTP